MGVFKVLERIVKIYIITYISLKTILSLIRI